MRLAHFLCSATLVVTLAFTKNSQASIECSSDATIRLANIDFFGMDYQYLLNIPRDSLETVSLDSNCTVQNTANGTISAVLVLVESMKTANCLNSNIVISQLTSVYNTSLRIALFESYTTRADVVSIPDIENYGVNILDGTLPKLPIPSPYADRNLFALTHVMPKDVAVLLSCTGNLTFTNYLSLPTLYWASPFNLAATIFWGIAFLSVAAYGIYLYTVLLKKRSNPDKFSTGEKMRLIAIIAGTIQCLASIFSQTLSYNGFLSFRIGSGFGWTMHWLGLTCQLLAFSSMFFRLLSAVTAIDGRAEKVWTVKCAQSNPVRVFALLCLVLNTSLQIPKFDTVDKTTQSYQTMMLFITLLQFLIVVLLIILIADFSIIAHVAQDAAKVAQSSKLSSQRAVAQDAAVTTSATSGLKVHLRPAMKTQNNTPAGNAIRIFHQAITFVILLVIYFLVLAYSTISSMMFGVSAPYEVIVYSILFNGVIIYAYVTQYRNYHQIMMGNRTSTMREVSGNLSHASSASHDNK